jgi:Ca2+-binding EF-hand superfamily protein
MWSDKDAIESDLTDNLDPQELKELISEEVNNQDGEINNSVAKKVISFLIDKLKELFDINLATQSDEMTEEEAKEFNEGYDKLDQEVRSDLEDDKI